MKSNQTFILFTYERMSYPTYSDLELEIQQLEEENKRLKATLDAFARQVNRLEQRLLKYEKVHDGKFIEKDITTSESKSLFD